MTESLGILDARSRFSELIDRAERGEEIVITRRGAPVARIVPAAKPRRTPEEVKQALDAAKRIREALASRGVKVTQADIRAWRDEGRS